MKKLALLLWSIPMAVFFIACSEDEEVIVIQNDQAIILSFEFNQLDPVVSGEINENANTILLNVTEDTDVSTLIPTIELSSGATVSPGSGVAQDFSSPVSYTVTAEAGNEIKYVVTVEKVDKVPTEEPKSSEKSITAFSFDALSPVVSGKVNEEGNTITLLIPWDTKVEMYDVVPTIAVSERASVSPASGVSQNFYNKVVYTVTAEDGSTRAYEVSVTQEDAPDITAESPEQKTYAKGDSVTIFGTDFFDVVVDLGGKSTSYTIIPTIKSKTELTFGVPNYVGVDTGAYSIQLRSGEQKINLGEITVTLPRPEITEFSKSSVTAGDEIRVSGRNFSESENEVFLVRGDVETLASTKKQTTSYLDVVVPILLSSGDYSIKIVTKDSREVVSALVLSVTENTSTDPIIASVNKTTLKWGEKLIITGKNFTVGKLATIGFLDGRTATKVRNVKINSETEAEITIDQDIPAETYYFYIEQSGNFSNDFHSVTITE